MKLLLERFTFLLLVILLTLSIEENNIQDSGVLYLS